MENILLSPELQSFVLEVLLIFIAAAVPVLVQRLVVFINQKIDAVRASIPEAQLAFIDQLAATLVQAAEQSGLAGHIENVGKAKLDKAMADGTAYLESIGWKNFPLEMLRAAIESAILNGLDKPALFIEEEIDVEE